LVKETKYWVWSLSSAVVILIVLGMHMMLMHLDGILGLVESAWGDALAWRNVRARGQSDFFAASYVLLLGAALFHGLYGLRTILIEFWTSPRAARLIVAGCWTLGLALFTVGTYATVAFRMAATG
jgi:succinate dehydrogenase hydrophobic anchor subunit